METNNAAPETLPGEILLLGVPVTVRASRLGTGYTVASRFESWGLLGFGATRADALLAAEGEITGRRERGAPSLLAVRASGRRSWLFTEAESTLAGSRAAR